MLEASLPAAAMLIRRDSAPIMSDMDEPLDWQTIDVDELAIELALGEIVVIDVLPRASFEKQRLPDAVHVSFYEEGFVEGVLEQVEDRESRIAVYCLTKSCNASTRAARALTEAGFTNVLDFEGGLRAWEAAGREVVRGDA